MASRDSWIDPDEVSSLAGEIFPESKLVPKEKSEEYVPIQLLDEDDLVTVAVSEDVAADCDDEEGTADRIASRLRAIRERAERSGLLVGSKPKPPITLEPSPESIGLAIPEPFVLSGERLVERVTLLAAWMKEGFDQVFVLDELGDALVAGEIPAGLRSGAVRLAQSWERSQRWLGEEGVAATAPLAGAALGGGKFLSIVGVRCANGFYCAGLVGDQMVSVDHAARISEALNLVFC